LPLFDRAISGYGEERRCPMRIAELFEAVDPGAGVSAGVRARRGLTINGLKGKKAVLMPGQIVTSASSFAGLTGQWIIEHLGDEVPTNWVLG
jgi:hypothetical protein